MLFGGLLHGLGFENLAPLVSAAKSASIVRFDRFSALWAFSELVRLKRKMRRAAAFMRRSTAMTW